MWIVDSTPVECARSRETVKRSDLAGRAEYGYCPSRSRYFRGLRLHLICTLHGLLLGYALTGAKADEQQAFPDVLAGALAMAAVREDGQKQTVIADKDYFGHDFEATLEQTGLELLRPARKGEKPRAGSRFFNR